MKFKIGDRVRLNRHFNDSCWPLGYEFTVEGFKNFNEIRGKTKEFEQYGIGSIPEDACSLIEYSELENLIKIANEGQKVIPEMYNKYKDKLILDSSPCGSYVIYSIKKNFEPFFVKDGFWQVEKKILVLKLDVKPLKLIF